MHDAVNLADTPARPDDRRSPTVVARFGGSDSPATAGRKGET